MKMKIGTELPDGYSVGHEDLAEATITLMGQALLPLFAENMSEDMAKANVAGIITELAYLFDDGQIEIGGKTYHPRLAFVDDTGSVLPGVAALNTLADMTDDPFDIAPEAQITFEAAEFDDG